jgi:hypothetical protein
VNTDVDVLALLAHIENLNKLLACYRIGKYPSETLLNSLGKTTKRYEAIKEF